MFALNTYLYTKGKSMNTKLTLTVEEEIIADAKAYAKKRGQSLSDLVENYFKLLTKENRIVKPKQLSPRIRRLRGILKVERKNYDYREELEQELSKKYDS